MNAHKAIEQINTLLNMPTARANNEFSNYLTKLKASISSSVKFYFAQWEVPNKFRISYVPLPFDNCLFEPQFTDGKTIMLSLKQINKDTIKGEILKKTLYGLDPQGITFTANNDNGSVYYTGNNSVSSVSLYDENEIQKETKIAVHLMLGFNQIMACSNIIYENHQPSKQLNKKRKKKGKPQIFIYKTLKIDCGDRVVKNGVGGDNDRHSPRIHLRRGHIRTMQNGKTTWVQPCVVGDKTRGVVVKDYHVSAQGT